MHFNHLDLFRISDFGFLLLFVLGVLCFGPLSAVPGRSYTLLLAFCPDQDTVRANVRTETVFAPARIRVRLHSLTVAPEV